MTWPTPQEYNEAIQAPRLCFSDEDLLDGQVEVNQLGLPKSRTGAFASVYKVTSASGVWAVRCFLSNRPEQKERYEKISAFVEFDDLDCTTPFYYLEQGIRVHGSWHPVLKMRWEEGPTLGQHIEKHYDNRKMIAKLRQMFYDMVIGLEFAGIAHGDLQHGNLIVTREGLRLVDYDALFVPDLLGKGSLELGHPNYQHPDRTANHYDDTMDNFSCWLIDSSLRFIELDSRLYRLLDGGDECILLRRRDLLSPEQSDSIRILMEHPAKEIQAAISRLIRMLWAAPHEVPPLNATQEALETLPKVKPQRLYGTAGSGRPDDSPEKLISRASSRSTCHVERLTTNRFQNLPGEFTNPGELSRPSDSFRQRLEIWKSHYDRKSEDIRNRLNRFFDPRGWIEKRMIEARLLLHNNNYAGAISEYQDAYTALQPLVQSSSVFAGNSGFKLLSDSDKRIIDSVEYVSYRHLLVDVLTRIGLCYYRNNETSLASTYFLLATQESNHSGYLSYERALVMLALCKYKLGNQEGAFLALIDDRNIPSKLTEIVRSESSEKVLLDMVPLLMELAVRCDDFGSARHTLFSLRECYLRVRNSLSEENQLRVMAPLVNLGYLLAGDNRNLVAEEIFNEVMLNADGLKTVDSSGLVVECRAGKAVALQKQKKVFGARRQLSILSTNTRELVQLVFNASPLMLEYYKEASPLFSSTAKEFGTRDEQAAEDLYVIAWYLYNIQEQESHSRAFRWLENKKKQVIHACLHMSSFRPVDFSTPAPTFRKSHAYSFIEEIVRTEEKDGKTRQLYPKSLIALSAALLVNKRYPDFLFVATQLGNQYNLRALIRFFGQVKPIDLPALASGLASLLNEFPWISIVPGLLKFSSGKGKQTIHQLLLDSLTHEDCSVNLEAFSVDLIRDKDLYTVKELSNMLAEQQDARLAVVLNRLSNEFQLEFNLLVNYLTGKGHLVFLGQLIEELTRRSNYQCIEVTASSLAKHGHSDKLLDTLERIDMERHGVATGLILAELVVGKSASTIESILEQIIERRLQGSIKWLLLRMYERSDDMNPFRRAIERSRNLASLESPMKYLSFKEYLHSIVEGAIELLERRKQPGTTFDATLAYPTLEGWTGMIDFWLAEAHIDMGYHKEALEMIEKHVGRFHPRIDGVLARLNQDCVARFYANGGNISELRDLAALYRYYKGSFQNQELEELLKLIGIQATKDFTSTSSNAKLSGDLAFLSRFGRISEPIIEEALDAILEHLTRAPVALSEQDRLYLISIFNQHDWSRQRFNALKILLREQRAPS